MKILYCALDQTVPGTTGGSVHVTAVADGLAALGHEVHVVAPAPGLASYRLDPDGIDAVVTAAQKASSMRGNPIELSDDEVGEILTRSL